MELQKQFSQEYATLLKNQLGDPAFLENYERENFPVDESEGNIVKIPGVYNNHVDLTLSKDPSQDFPNAVLFFEAYKTLSPLIASQESFWAYMTHVEYFEYAKARWPKGDDSDAANHYKRHFFIEGNMLKIARNAMARLWWPVYMTYDTTNSDPYHLTKIFFTNTQVVQTMSESQLFTCRPLTQGVLGYFEKHSDVIPTKANIDNIMQYFNALGGVRQLAFEEKDFFIQTIEKEINL